MIPSWPPLNVGRPPRESGPPSAYGLFDTSTIAGSLWSTPTSSTTFSAEISVAGPRTGRGLEQCTNLGVAISRATDRLGIDPERDVVEKDAAVHLADVDPALDAVVDGIKRRSWIGRIQAQVTSEVVARSSRDADEGQIVAEGSLCHRCQRPVAARHGQRVGAGRHGLVDLFREAAIRAELRDADPAFPGLLRDPWPGPTAGPRVDEQRWLARRIDPLPLDRREGDMLGTGVSGFNADGCRSFQCRVVSCRGAVSNAPG